MSQPQRDSDSRVTLQPHREAGMDLTLVGRRAQEVRTPSPHQLTKPTEERELVCTSQAITRRVGLGGTLGSQAGNRTCPARSLPRKRKMLQCPMSTKEIPPQKCFFPSGGEDAFVRTVCLPPT